MMKNKGLIIVAIILAVLLILFSWFRSTYNNMVKEREAVKAQFSNVQTQCQRRADLIPNLVNTVKGYATHEEGTLTAVVDARAKATQMQVNVDDAHSVAEYLQAQGELSSALNRLMAVSESYPDLKANANFLDLQTQLEGTENRIAVERRRYNELAQSFNTYIKFFPRNLVAGMFGFEEEPYYEAAEGAEVAPVVEF